jgi:flagellar hook-length control protein FliK
MRSFKGGAEPGRQHGMRSSVDKSHWEEPRRKNPKSVHHHESRSNFDSAYRKVARANAEARHAARSKSRREDHESSCSRLYANRTEAEKQPQILDESIEKKARELAQELDFESFGGLMEMLMAQNPSSELLQALQQGDYSDFDISKLSGIEGIDGEGNLVTAGQIQNKQAWMIIRQSLTIVSQTFQLNVSDELKEMEMARIDDNIIRQFSDILHALRAIGGILEDAVKENVTLDVQGEVLEPEKAVEMGKSVRFEIFRLQVGFQMLGMSGEVNNEASKLQNLPVYQGIPQAADLASLTQSPSQIKQFFASLIDDTESHLKSVISRLGKLSEGDISSESARVLAAKFQSGAGSQDSKPVEFTSFDSLVLRRLLNIDAAQQGSPGAARGSAAESLIDNSHKGTGISFKGSMSAMSLKQSFQFQQVSLSSSNLTGENQGAVSELMNRLQMPAQTGDVTGRATLTPHRSWEESLMNQISERFNLALKNGVHEARIQLRPESLGEVQLKIQVDGDVVTAKIQVESQQVRQIVESNLQQLKNALAEHNLQAGNFDVNVGQDSDTHNLAENSSQDRGVGNTGRHGNEPSGENEDYENGQELKSETGRRFGSNTIEYFA